jgi:hypothetical protein
VRGDDATGAVVAECTAYGGTDQVQKNIIADRSLDLSREPHDDRTTPFRDLAKNS